VQDFHPQSQASERDADRERVKLFIGKNADYYLMEWEQATGQKYVTWNWAAFFFSVFWLLYRKMFRQAGLVLALIAIESLGEKILFPDMPDYISNGLSSGIGMAVAGFLGRFGNDWYKKHVDKAVSRLKASDAPVESYRKQGGTSWLLAILVLAGYLIAFVVIASVLYVCFFR
jgi:hypothetical protein